MKNSIVLIASFMVLFSSCTQDDKVSSVEKVTEEEAVEVMLTSIESESLGVSEQVEEVSEVTTEALVANPLCGSTMDTSIVKQYSTTNTTVDFTFNWNRVINCVSNVVSDYTFSYTTAGSYNSPRITSSSNASGELVLSQLYPADSEYLVEIDYLRNGTHESKIGNENSFSSTITSSCNNMLVDKSTLKITSGTMNISINGSTSGGVTFSYSGVVVFLGNGAATITLSNGSVYNASI